MASGISVSLGFLWNFLKPILSDAMKDRLKPKGSVETAKRRALHLYKTLGEINQMTDDFVTALQSFAESIEGEASKVTITEKKRTLKISACVLMRALPKLVGALEELNPQLDIHQHELVQEVNRYVAYRGFILDRTFTTLSRSVDEIDSESKAMLKQLVTQADKNRNLIRKAIEDFRGFLAKEFPFKEIF